MSSFVQYSRAEPGSISIKLAVYQRRKMFDVFLSATGIQPEDTVLDVESRVTRHTAIPIISNTGIPTKLGSLRAAWMTQAFLKRCIPD